MGIISQVTTAPISPLGHLFIHLKIMFVTSARNNVLDTVRDT